MGVLFFAVLGRNTGMRVMSDVTDPDQRKHTMTETRGKAEIIDAKAVLADDDAFIRTVVRAALQEVLEAEMPELWARARASGRQTGWAIAAAAQPALGLAAVGVHTFAMLATICLVAVAVYEYFGLAFLRRGWINLDLIWTAALLITGLVLIAI
jgi:hypothetical protein